MLALNSSSAGVSCVGDTTLVNCTFSHNSNSFAGAIYGGGILKVDSCTIYGNSGEIGGGIRLNAASLYLTNCTITANSSSAPGPGINHFGGSTAIVRNSIIAGNTHTSTSGPNGDCFGIFISGGYNLIGKAIDNQGWTGVGDQTGTTNAPLNPLLGPLKNNGGPTFTMAPFNGSPVIDQGHNGASITDQRGLPRPYDKPDVPNAPGGNGSDIGAFEASYATLLVTNLNDSGPGSLRQTILNAASVDSNTIAFHNLTGTISLGGIVLIEKDLTIAGPGAKLLSISGNFNNRIFEVLNGTVSISGLTLTDGRAVGVSASAEQNGLNERGGAIFNQGSLSLSDCVITNCSVVGGTGGATQDGSAGNGGRGLGGAIANLGTLALTRCTLSGNSATGGTGGQATGFGSPGSGGLGFGGGVYNEGVASITNCTISANQAIAGTGNGGEGTGSGGGIYSELNAVLMNSTIASNNASGSSFDFGGGIFDNGTNFVVRSSTIAGNQATYGPGLYSVSMDLGNTILSANNSTAGSGDGSGTVVSSDYNLISNNSNFTITGLTTHNIIGQNALLGPLQDNGGPTFTMALRTGSPAIDRGKNFGITTDQRGRARPYDFPNVANVTGGDASDIGAFELTPPILSIAALSGGNVLLSWSTNDAGYTLESRTNLNPGFSWLTVPGTPTVVGSQFTVTNSAVGNSFFRLKQ
jgi:hypothetical protein